MAKFLLHDHMNRTVFSSKSFCLVKVFRFKIDNAIPIDVSKKNQSKEIDILIQICLVSTRGGHFIKQITYRKTKLYLHVVWAALQ